MPSDVLSQLLTSSTMIFKPDGPWSFVGHSADVRAVADTRKDSADTAGADAKSGENVSPEIDAAAQSKWSQVMAGSNLIVLRDQENGLPVDVVSTAGRFAGDDPPAVDCLADYTTRSRARNINFILAAFTPQDLARLYLLGLPVTPASGLADLTAIQAQKLLANLKNSSPTAPQGEKTSHSLGGPVRLVLVGTELHPGKNQMPAGVLHVVNQFNRVHVRMKANIEQVGIWLPTAPDFRSITDCVHLANLALVRDAVVRAVGRSTISIREYLASTSGPPLHDLLTKLDQIETTLATLRTTTQPLSRLPDQIADAKKAYDIHLVEPLRRAAMREKTPGQKLLLFSAAEVAGMLRDVNETLLRAEARLTTGDAANVSLALTERAGLLGRLIDMIVKIMRACGTGT